MERDADDCGAAVSGRDEAAQDFGAVSGRDEAEPDCGAVSGRDEAALEPEPVFEDSNVFRIWLNMPIFICRTCFWT